MLPLVGNNDEALDIKPTVTIEGKQLELLNIANAQVGQEYELSSPAKIVKIYQDKGDEANGIPPVTSVTFELSRVQVESEEADLSAMYPNSPSQS